MKTINDLALAIQSGNRPVVTFKSRIDELENYAELGMRTRLTGVIFEQDDVVKLQVDFTEFDEVNRSFETTNYYSSDGEPVLTARQAGYYHVKDSLYMMGTDSISDFFELENSARLALFQAYKDSGSTSSYMAWLEDRVLATDDFLSKR